MLFVDTSVGSKDLINPLKVTGIEVVGVKLDWADLEFAGRGVGGKSLSIGVEIKRLSELCSDWDRFAGFQLPMMVEHYDYRYLVYEGEWRQDRHGRLLRRGRAGRLQPLGGQDNAAALRKKLLGLPLRGGILVYPTRDRVDTIRWLLDCYRMWTDEDFDRHTSHIAVYHAHGLVKHSDFVVAVSAWPGVGLSRARAAEKVFKGSVRRAALAGPSEWEQVETLDDNGKARRIGLKVATQIDDFLEGE